MWSMFQMSSGARERENINKNLVSLKNEIVFEKNRIEKIIKIWYNIIHQKEIRYERSEHLILPDKSALSRPAQRIRGRIFCFPMRFITTVISDRRIRAGLLEEREICH